MAKPKTSSKPKSDSTTKTKKVVKSDANVTKISASTKQPRKKPATPTPSKSNKLSRGIKSFLGYFTGAWHELRLVRWPNGRATWSLTGALLVFTAGFIALILLVDVFFEYIFKLILR